MTDTVPATGPGAGPTASEALLRDVFAAQSMIGLLSNGRYGDPTMNLGYYATVAYQIADAMLVQRDATIPEAATP